MKFSLLSLPILASFYSVAFAQGFLETCTYEGYWQVDPNVYHYYADCYNFSGSLVLSQLNLNVCIGNNNGVLTGGGVNYAASCESCSLGVASAVLECQCADYNGNYQSTSIGLNDIISNNNGYLYCAGITGTLCSGLTCP